MRNTKTSDAGFHSYLPRLRIVPSRIIKSLARTAVAVCIAATAPMALADWSPSQEKIDTYSSWIYTPLSTLPSGKRALMVVLHGCAQTNTELKLHGNLAPAAEAAGMVLMVPQADAKNEVPGTGCWDFDRGSDGHHNVAEIVKLTRLMVERTSLNIDPAHVYVVGLSSGAALSLLLGCAAPDLFAGVAAIAGPSVGTAQSTSLEPDIGVDHSDKDVKNAVEKCRSLAGGKSASFKTQIANIAYGTLDKDGPEAKYDFCLPLLLNGFCWFQKKHPGEYRVVSVKWSDENIKVLKAIYGDDDLGNPVKVQGDKGLESTAKGNGKVQLGLLVIPQVGHAWPAGSGRANGPGGDWIAQSGLNYPKYITEWLLQNNRRAGNP